MENPNKNEKPTIVADAQPSFNLKSTFAPKRLQPFDMFRLITYYCNRRVANPAERGIWREFAIKDQLKMQAYVAIVYNENNGKSYSTLYETSKVWDTNHFGYATSSNRKPQNCP